MKAKLFPISLVLVIGLATAARAHTPYLLPNAFEPINGGLVTLDASFAEHFFVPEVVFDGSDFEVWMPDGSKTEPETIIPIRSRIVIEHDMTEEGTYRFSTGRRIGRVFKMYELDGRRLALEDPNEPVPEGAELVDHYQSNTMAETYITRGGPDQAALQARDDGLEFLPVSHPNDLFAGETLEMQALFYGKPLEGLTIDAFLASRQFGDDSPTAVLTSGPDGRIEFTPDAQGIYLLRSRHRAAATTDEYDAPEVSHTYTLVVEAF